MKIILGFATASVIALNVYAADTSSKPTASELLTSVREAIAAKNWSKAKNP
jgi:hypothetical protein